MEYVQGFKKQFITLLTATSIFFLTRHNPTCGHAGRIYAHFSAINIWIKLQPQFRLKIIYSKF